MKNTISSIRNNSKYSGLLGELEGATFTSAEKEFIFRLIDAGQGHLLEQWDSAGDKTEEKKSLVVNLMTADNAYPGGIAAYIDNARRLLAQAKEMVNPYDGFFPYQPDTIDLSSFGEQFSFYENIALKNIGRIGIVLVAGGLGERLGYSGIKLDIPMEVINNVSYIQYYASVIHAMESRLERDASIPLVIMTSRDTHDKTVECLRNNNNFGLSEKQVVLLKQELVPALADNDGRIAQTSKYGIEMKPHGHGDIHMLMHTSGTAEMLYEQGIRYLLFIQDTNGQVFNAGFAAVGVSMHHKYDFNSIGVNRVPGEAVGALTTLKKGSTELTVNIEYNQLDPLLRATVSPEGDIANERGHSIFPGNINVLVIGLETYRKVLKNSGGIIAEFVNPKYADKNRTTFQKPTRLETMMQDLPKLFTEGEKVGVTVFDRKWCFSPDKNNTIDAKAKHEKGAPPESAATAESDFYHANRIKLLLAGARISETPEILILGIPFINGPKVILSPSFAISTGEVISKTRNIRLSGEATLILNGPDIEIDGLTLSERSALVINAVAGARVKVKNLEITNNGFEMVKLNKEELADPFTPEYLKIRGYRFIDRGARIFNFDKPGDYVIQVKD